MNPSLLLIPDRYKASKLYSQIPDSGAGDLAFTRANDTATRVNSAGLIEKVRTNVLLYSEQLNNGAWSLATATISANAAVAPDGTTTADKLIPSIGADPSAADASQLQQVLAVASNGYAFSIFAKAAGQNSVRIRENNSWGNFLNVNLTTGAFNIIGGNFGQFNNVQVETLPNGWYRISFATEVGVTNFSKYSIRGGETGDGTSGVFLWGAQLETGDIATPYIPTTTAAVSVGPVANIPRIDYTGGGCGKLLLEPQRTNTSPYSEQFTLGWTASAGTPVTANTTISPSGYQDADTLAEAGNGDYLFQNVTSASGTFTVSVFAKKGSSTNFGIGLVAGGFTAGMSVQFNFDTQTFATPINYSNFTSISATSQNYGNGWYRLSLTGTTASATSYFFVLGSLLGSAYAANVRIWGAQAEAGSYATSYIPTLGASVTRSADSASKTGISSLIGQQEGVVYWEGILPQASSNGPTFASNIFNTEREVNSRTAIGITHVASTSTLSVSFFIGDGSFTPLATLNAASLPAGSFAKIAFAYKSGSFALYANGVLKDSSTLTYTSITTINEINLNDNVLYYGYTAQQSVQAAGLYYTRLTNAELQTLTSL